MLPPPELRLSDHERAVIEAALADDPALGADLEAIDRWLEPAARRRFWTALAAALPAHARPATAVLEALERAAGAGR